MIRLSFLFRAERKLLLRRGEFSGLKTAIDALLFASLAVPRRLLKDVPQGNQFGQLFLAEHDHIRDLPGQLEIAGLLRGQRQLFDLSFPVLVSHGRERRGEARLYTIALVCGFTNLLYFWVVSGRLPPACYPREQLVGIVSTWPG